MFEGFEDLQLPVFVSLVLEDFLNGDFLASSPYMAMEYCPERAFTCYAVDFVSFGGCDSFHIVGGANLADFPAMNLMALIMHKVLLIGLRSDILIEYKGFGGMDFKGFSGEAFLGLHFGINLKISGFIGLIMGLDSMSGWVKELVGFVDGA